VAQAHQALVLVVVVVLVIETGILEDKQEDDYDLVAVPPGSSESRTGNGR